MRDVSWMPGMCWLCPWRLWEALCLCVTAQVKPCSTGLRIAQCSITPSVYPAQDERISWPRLTRGSSRAGQTPSMLDVAPFHLILCTPVSSLSLSSALSSQLFPSRAPSFLPKKRSPPSRPPPSPLAQVDDFHTICRDVGYIPKHPKPHTILIYPYIPHTPYDTAYLYIQVLYRAGRKA
jgi:hypothetical protein